MTETILLVIGSPLLFLGAIQFSFGIVCFFKARRENLVPFYAALATWITSAWCFAAGIFYAMASQKIDAAFYYRLCWIATLGMPAFIQVGLTLRTKAHRLASLVNLLSFPFWTCVVLLNIFTEWIDRQPSSLLPYVDRSGPFEIPARVLVTINLAFCFYTLARARYEARGIKRQQANYFLLGVMIFAVGSLVIIFPVSGTYLIDPGLGAYASIPWTSLAIYAVMKHRLFDIRAILARVSTSVFMTVIVGGIQISIFYYFLGVIGMDGALILSVLLTALLALTSPVLSYVRRLSAFVFLRKSFDYQSALRQASEALVSILNQDEIIRKLIEIARKNLGVESACFWLKKGDKYEQAYSLGFSEKKSLDLNNKKELLSWIVQHQMTIVSEEHENDPAFSKLSRELVSKEAEVLVPIFLKSNLTGVLILGGKKNGDAFIDDDINFLKTLSSQVAVVLEKCAALCRSDDRRAHRSLPSEIF